LDYSKFLITGRRRIYNTVEKYNNDNKNITVRPYTFILISGLLKVPTLKSNIIRYLDILYEQNIYDRYYRVPRN
jgi:hypothetical protein